MCPPASAYRAAAPSVPPNMSRTVGFQGYPRDSQAESPGELVENTDLKAQPRITKLEFSGLYLPALVFLTRSLGILMDSGN